MATDPKLSSPAPSRPGQPRGQGIRIFTYPKVIFFFPTMVAALVCGLGEQLIGNDTSDPTKTPAISAGAPGEAAAPQLSPMEKHKRFTTPQNLLGVLFLGVFAFNLIIMALDFPRFTLVAIFLLVLFSLFFILWIGAYFDYDLMKPMRAIFGSIFAVANSGFYYMIAAVMFGIFVLVYITRWLDYWEIMPNEILHHHGPLSDLERFPTTNLKFDKEIPDVLEFLFLGAGRLVLHVANERKSIVLDNVLFINSKESALKKMMSRLEVRITTDQEVSET
jgi:hypothetical protein